MQIGKLIFSPEHMFIHQYLICFLAKISHNVNLKRYTSEEMNGLIYIWYHSLKTPHRLSKDFNQISSRNSTLTLSLEINSDMQVSNANNFNNYSTKIILME